jgi:N-acetylmuramoyl-L-alanine amidase
MMLTELADIARRTGYPVVEVPGWKTRGRPGGMLGVRTITNHHTANGGAKGNYPSLRVVRDGRSGLPGPLAQLGVGVDGTIYVIAAGKCNHAGASRSIDYTNSYAIGIEAEAEGVPNDPEDWPPAQMDSLTRLDRVLIDHYQGLTSADVRGHKETCAPVGRKTDPSFNMNTLRSRVRNLNPVRLAPASTPSKGDTVAKLEPDDVKAITQGVVQQTIYDETPGEPRAITTVGATLTRIDRAAEANKADADANQQVLVAKLDQVLTAISGLTEGIRALTATRPGQ